MRSHHHPLRTSTRWFPPHAPCSVAVTMSRRRVTDLHPAIDAALEAHPAGPAWLEQLSDPVMHKIPGEFFVDLIRMGMVEGIIRAAGRLGPTIVRAAPSWAVSCRRHPRPAGRFRGRRQQGLLADDQPGLVRLPRVRPSTGKRVAADDFEMLKIDRTRPA